MLESKFQKIVTNRLDELGKDCWYEIIQALTIRGIPDIIGCYKGKFFGWEIKRSEAEARKKTGRIVLQKHRIRKIQQAGGVGRVVFPENLEDCFQELLASRL